MATFQASLINASSGDVSITIGTGCTSISITDESNYDLTAAASGHERVRFDTYRKVVTEYTDGTKYTLSSMGDGDAAIVAAYNSGKLVTDADALLSSIFTMVTGGTIATYTNVTLTGGNGDARATVVLDSATNISSITVTTAGTGYKRDELVTIAATDLGGSSTIVQIRLVAGDLQKNDTFTSPLNSGDGVYKITLYTIPTYNASDTYIIGDIIIDSGIFYKSLQNSNTGQTPASSTTFWEVITEITDFTSKYYSIQRIAVVCALNCCIDDALHEAFCVVDSVDCCEENLCNNNKFMTSTKLLIVKKAIEASASSGVWTETEKQFLLASTLCKCC